MGNLVVRADPTFGGGEVNISGLFISLFIIILFIVFI